MGGYCECQDNSHCDVNSTTSRAPGKNVCRKSWGSINKCTECDKDSDCLGVENCGDEECKCAHYGKICVKKNSNGTVVVASGGRCTLDEHCVAPSICLPQTGKCSGQRNSTLGGECTKTEHCQSGLTC